jgi:hypothetical protein
MNNILTSFLTELTLKSKTNFIEAKDNEELINLAKARGITLPSPDLACIETIYGRLDVPNLNKVMLPKEVAEKGITTLVGKQVNKNHLGKNYVVGYIIDAKIVNNYIVTTAILFKSLFEEEFEEVEQLFDEGKLFVSWELWKIDPETEESILVEKNGISVIQKMIAHGCGLLFRGINPACREAQVFRLLAKQKNVEEGENIFVEDNRFAYASFSDENEQHNKEEVVEISKEIIEKVNEESKKEEQKIEEKEQTQETVVAEEKKSEEIVATEIKTEEVVLKDEKTSETAEVVDASTEVKQESNEQVQVESVEKSTAPEQAQVVETPAEQKVEESKTEEVKEVAQTEEPKPVNLVSVVSEEIYVTVDTLDGKVEKKGLRKITKKFSDGTSSEQTEEFQVVNTYTEAQLEEKVSEAKLELENQIKVKDEEIKTLKAEVDSKSTLLVAKEQEVETVKAQLPKKEEKEETDLTIGEVKTEKGEDIYKKVSNDIDNLAFPKRK